MTSRRGRSPTRMVTAGRVIPGKMEPTRARPLPHPCPGQPGFFPESRGSPSPRRAFFPASASCLPLDELAEARAGSRPAPSLRSCSQSSVLTPGRCALVPNSLPGVPRAFPSLPKCVRTAEMCTCASERSLGNSGEVGIQTHASLW